eukprot:374854-Pleurochrysis_carterae.AAC.1
MPPPLSTHHSSCAVSSIAYAEPLLHAERWPPSNLNTQAPDSPSRSNTYPGTPAKVTSCIAVKMGARSGSSSALQILRKGGGEREKERLARLGGAHSGKGGAKGAGPVLEGEALGAVDPGTKVLWDRVGVRVGNGRRQTVG